ncbi:MAG: tyrosine-type recombinase/integrase, partial [Planctomycetia bacterium]
MTIRRCDPATPGAVKQSKRSKDWYVFYRDHLGVERRKRLCANRAAAQTMLTDLVVRVERRKAGLESADSEQRDRPLADHLADFQASMTGKGRSGKHIRLTIARVESVLRGTGAVYWRDLNGEQVQRLLDGLTNARTTFDRVEGTARTYAAIAKQFGVTTGAVVNWRKEGAPIRPRSSNDLAAIAEWRRKRVPTDASATTRNHRLTAMRMFTRWMVKVGRANRDPLATLSKRNEATDQRHVRRALTTEELTRLLAAAENGPTVGVADGPTRATVYALAAMAGLRHGEIAKLKRTDFDLEARALRV